MNENKFFLKDFFKTYSSKENSIEVSWDDLGKKIKPHQEEIKENIRKIGGFENINSLNSQTKKDIYNQYQVHWRQHKTVKEMASKDLKNLLHILFPDPNEGVEKGLYHNPDQFNDFLNTLSQKNKQFYLTKIISELLYHYPEPTNILFDRLSKVYGTLDRKKQSNKTLIRANNRFHLIEKSGPSNIAKNILNIEHNLDTLLSDLWIKERHLIAEIGDKIVTELCQLINHLLKKLAKGNFYQRDKEILERFLGYLSGEKNYNSIQPVSRYKDCQLIAKTLLNPFEYKKPEKGIKTIITRFLDQHIGDPRFSSEKWIAIPKEKDIFLKWKIGETIKDFLELLTYTAQKDPNADRMWPYRKEFIESYWSAGHITAAWIVLGKKAYKSRSKFLKENFTDYGQVISGANPIHSVLLFRIGELIISEWNYNGKVRIWNEGKKNTPVFYKKEYSREDLINSPDKKIIHSSAERYYWQKKLSDYIYEYTGISCPKSLQAKIDQF